MVTFLYLNIEVCVPTTIKLNHNVQYPVQKTRPFQLIASVPSRKSGQKYTFK